MKSGEEILSILNNPLKRYSQIHEEFENGFYISIQKDYKHESKFWINVSGPMDIEFHTICEATIENAVSRYKEWRDKYYSWVPNKRYPVIKITI